MDSCFIQYGYSVFKQRENVEFVRDHVLGETISQFPVFNSLCSADKKYRVDEIFLGWSFDVFLAEGKLYYCGLRNDSSGVSSIPHDTIENKIVKVACAWEEILIIAENGGCYSYDINSAHLIKLGVASVKVRDAAVGDMHSMLLTESGTIFSLYRDDIPLMLRPITVRTRITSVACGKDYVLLLALDGRLFTYGIGSRGQLGHGDTDPRNLPTLVEALDGIKIKSIAAGGWHAAVVSVIGDLYVWGWNESGQLGLPCAANSKRKIEEIVAFQSVPHPVDFNPEITVASASCGSRHTAMLTDEGTVWTWGWNGYGQLGTDHDICRDVPQPLELPSDFCVSKITCAYWSTLISGKYCTP